MILPIFEPRVIVALFRHQRDIVVNVASRQRRRRRDGAGLDGNVMILSKQQNEHAAGKLFY